MPKVVGRSGRDELAQRNGTQLGMLALERQFCLGQIPAAQGRQIFRAQARELIE
jgi:hypothetical protein